MEKEREEIKTIKSRGIPSKERFYLPAWNSVEIRRFQDEDEKQTRNLFLINEIVNFIFPKKYQETYNEIAINFFSFLFEKKVLYGNDISDFLNKNNISKATFYNRVLPRIKRIGLIKIERQTTTAIKKSQKTRPMKITISKTFGNYLMKIGDSWLAIVDDIRSQK